MGSFERILLATDLSPASAPAFDVAVRIARENGARLLIAHVYQLPVSMTSVYLPATIYEDLERAIRADAEKRIGALIEKAEQQGARASALLSPGFPDEEIVATVPRENIDLIVMGTHGRRGPARFFLGSVAARIVASAPCPVLTVRSDPSHT